MEPLRLASAARADPLPSPDESRLNVRGASPEHRPVGRIGVGGSVPWDPVRLEFPILSLHPGLRHRCVAPDVWGGRVAGGGAADDDRHRRRVVID